MAKNRLMEAIANPGRQPFIFIFVITLVLGIAANGLSSLVLDTLGEWLSVTFGLPKVLWQILVVFAMIFAVVAGLVNVPDVLRSVLGNSTLRVSQVNVVPMVQTQPGLILFMSLNKNSAARVAIEHHWEKGMGDLQHCWLICAGDEPLRVAEELVMELVEMGIPRRIFHYGFGYEFNDGMGGMMNLVPTKDQAEDPNFSRRVVDCLYEDGADRFGLMEADIVVDYTSGTKSMSAGMILACASPSRRLQYVQSDYLNSKPVNSRVMEVKLQYEVRKKG